MRSKLPDDRLADLEAQVRTLAARVLRLPEREALTADRMQVRLAKTVEDPDTEDYPSVVAPDLWGSYWVVFVDADGPTDDGAAILTPTDRSETPHAVVTNLSPQYIPEGALIWVFSYHGSWWTCVPAAGCWARMDDATVYKGGSSENVIAHPYSYSDYAGNITLDAEEGIITIREDGTYALYGCGTFQNSNEPEGQTFSVESGQVTVTPEFHGKWSDMGTLELYVQRNEDFLDHQLGMFEVLRGGTLIGQVNMNYVGAFRQGDQVMMRLRGDSTDDGVWAFYVCLGIWKVN